MQELPKTLLMFFWHFIKKHKLKYAFVFIAPIIVTFDVSVTPYALKLIVDGISNFKGPKEEILSVLAFPLTLYLMAWILVAVIMRSSHWVNSFLEPDVSSDMRMTLFNYVKYHSHLYFANNFAGSIANKINDLPRSTMHLFLSIRWKIITTLIIFLVSLIVVSLISFSFAITIFSWSVLHSCISLYLARNVGYYSKTNAEDNSALSGKIVDIFSNMTSLRSFARENYDGKYVLSYQNIAKKSEYKRNIEIWKISFFTEFPAFIFICVIFYLLISGWQAGRINAGDFVLILMLSSRMIEQIWNLGNDLSVIFQHIGICQQAFSIISNTHEIKDIENAKELKPHGGQIEFKGVNFQYKQGNLIFKDKNLLIKSGEKVGLVGLSGSGKSTFVNLISRIYDLSSGSIEIDGQDISKVTQNSLRQSISVIPQDTILFHRSILDNIRYGRLDATDEEVIAASKKASCHKFIQELENKYDTLVGERGVKLSGGQRQRIAIARAILKLKQSSILILDEATSSLDSITEKNIQASLEYLMKGQTTIVVAHRLSTLSYMDRILVFEEGKIVEKGSHTDLLRIDGYYAKLFNMQVDGFMPEKEIL